MKWIAMSYREPPKGRYIAFFKDGQTGIIDWPGQWKSKKWYPTGCIITYWMKMPPSPTAEEWKE